LRSEILFCHEYDIHLEFDQSNEVVNDIIEAWKGKNIIQEKVYLNKKALQIIDLQGLKSGGGEGPSIEHLTALFALVQQIKH
jgi:hypothetical protein